MPLREYVLDGRNFLFEESDAPRGAVLYEAPAPEPKAAPAPANKARRKPANKAVPAQTN